MTLTLHFHPFSSFCQKVLIALYDNDTAFEREIVNLGDPASAAAFKKLWPIGKFPVLRDDARGETVPESSMIIEYLARHYPGRTELLPANAELAHRARRGDRFFDLYVNVPMQKVVTDNLRPEEKSDPHGVEQAWAQLSTALCMIDRDMEAKTWAIGDIFTLADCAAAPALFYADAVIPLEREHRHAAAYLRRLRKRPSFARALEEAKPYRQFFPMKDRSPNWDLS
ncbi:MAG: glutathione S-transferase family protein [Methyloceanibacter sp.]